MVPKFDGTRFLTGGPCDTSAQVEAYFATRIRFAVRRIGAWRETTRREDNMSKMKELREGVIIMMKKKKKKKGS